MAIITVTTPFNIDLEFKVALFGKRVFAWLTDMVVITLYYYLMLKFIYPFAGNSEGVTSVSSFLIITIPVMLYQVVFEMLMNGQTIGKMVTGIKVMDKEGKEPTMGQYITRWLLCLGNLFIYIVPYILFEHPWFMFGFIMLYIPDGISMMVSAKSQKISDLAAGTVVIDKNYRPDISETIYLGIENDGYVPLFPEVMRLPDRDINGIRNLLKNEKPSKSNDTYMISIAQKIKSVLSITSDLYAPDFLQQLLRDYNYYTTKDK